MGSVEDNQDDHLDEHMWAPEEDDKDDAVCSINVTQIIVLPMFYFNLTRHQMMI